MHVKKAPKYHLHWPQKPKLGYFTEHLKASCSLGICDMSIFHQPCG